MRKKNYVETIPKRVWHKQKWESFFFLILSISSGNIAEGFSGDVGKKVLQRLCICDRAMDRLKLEMKEKIVEFSFFFSSFRTFSLYWGNLNLITSFDRFIWPPIFGRSQTWCCYGRKEKFQHKVANLRIIIKSRDRVIDREGEREWESIGSVYKFSTR